MNKQEFQQKIKDMKPPKFFTAITLGEAYEAGFEEAKGNALYNSGFLNEPEKPVIPKYVADWIEWCKKNKITFLGADTAICNNKNIRTLDASVWATKNQETFTKAWFYGYEIEKEKRYTVEIPIANSPMGYHYVLRKTTSGEIIIDSFFTDKWGNYGYCQLTEEEIKKDHGWAWKYAKEANNNDD